MHDGGDGDVDKEEDGRGGSRVKLEEIWRLGVRWMSDPHYPLFLLVLHNNQLVKNFSVSDFFQLLHNEVIKNQQTTGETFRHKIGRTQGISQQPDLVCNTTRGEKSVYLCRSPYYSCCPSLRSAQKISSRKFISPGEVFPCAPA